MRKFTYSSLITLILLVIALNAQATFLPSWTFDVSFQTVQPQEVVYLNSTLYNDSTAGSNLTGSVVSSAGVFPVQYVFTPGAFPEGPFDLAPDDSFDFLFGTLTPVDMSGVPTGIYEITGAAIELELGTDTGNPDILEVSGEGLTIAVTPVPEPATIVLLILGLFGLGVYTNKRNTA